MRHPAQTRSTTDGRRTPRRHGLRFAAAATVVMVAASACSSGSDTTAERTTPPASSGSAPSTAATSAAGTSPAAQDQSGPRTIAQNLQTPWSIAFHGPTALVSERDSGRILELTSNGGTREIGRVGNLRAVGESGLLGIAVRGNELYAYSTTPSDNRIQRFALTGSPGSLSLGAPREVLTGLPSGVIHNGGRIAFGPDGMLYATVGDTADTSRPQRQDDLGGKILRMTPDGKVPAGNPFPGSLVYSLGHRNPQGLAWGSDGTLYSSELGQDTWDELNVIKPGANFGWPEVEGKGGRDGFTDPVQQWRPSEASPSGIAIIDDTIYVTNLRGARLRAVPTSDLGTSTESMVDEHGRLRDAARAPDGRLWVLTNNTTGNGTPRDGDDRILSIAPPG